MRRHVTVMTQTFPAPVITPNPQPGLRGAAIVLSAMLAIMVDGTSTAIIGTGLPYLQSIVTSSPDEASWIITAFNAAYYACILFSPWMMARFGNRRVLLTALLGFTALSLLLSATTDFHAFVVLRFLQGACLGCVFVPSVIMFFTSLPPVALRYAAPGFVLAAISGGTLGTYIGAYTADTYAGNIVFIPAAIVTAATALLVYFAAHKHDKPQSGLPIDYIGICLSTIAFGSMQYLSNEGQRRNWLDDGSIVAAAIVLFFSLSAFVVYELFGTRTPHVDLRMFARYRNLVVGSLINIIIGITGYSVTLLVAYLQTSIGATPTAAGALIPVRLATYLFGVPTAFMLTAARVLNVRSVVMIGAIGSAIGFLWYSQIMTTTAEMSSFIAVSLFFGFFFSMLSQPIGTLVIGSIPLPLLAAGISIYKLSSPLGSMIATGATQAYLADRAALFQSDIAGSLRLGRPGVEQYLFQHHGNAAGMTALAAHESQALAFGAAMTSYAIVLLFVIPVVCFIKSEKRAER